MFSGGSEWGPHDGRGLQKVDALERDGLMRGLKWSFSNAVAVMSRRAGGGGGGEAAAAAAAFFLALS